MAEKVYPVRLFPDTVLRRNADPVTDFGPGLRKIVERLAETMARQPSGIGIAAPQAGLPLSIAIVDVSSRVPGAGRLVLINPVILQADDWRLSKEGCMSVPEYTAYLRRADKIRYRWQDETGRRHEKTSEGLEAVCVQHEVDHLNGILFIDRVACLKTDMFPRTLKKSR